jgi:hypothetical protein
LRLLYNPAIIVSKPTLLVLAAGMGSRYGGLKQIDAVGPAYSEDRPSVAEGIRQFIARGNYPERLWT